MCSGILPQPMRNVNVYGVKQDLRVDAYALKVFGRLRHIHVIGALLRRILIVILLIPNLYGNLTLVSR